MQNSVQNSNVSQCQQNDMVYVNQIKIDWLRFSFSAHSWQWACALFGVSFSGDDWLDKRRYFKELMTMPYEGVTIAADSRPDDTGAIDGRFIGHCH